MLPETAAAERIGRTLFKHLDAHGTFSEKHKTEVGGKVVAHRGFIAQVFRELDNDPGAIPNDRIRLRNQKVNEVESLEWFIQEAHYHKKAYEEAVDMIDRITAQRLAEGDPDARGADEDDARIARERAADKAIENAPRIRSAS